LTPADSQRLVLLTGASGYVGGRLLELLQRRGVAVRCLARNAETLAKRCGSGTEVVVGDVLARESLDAPLAGVDTAYYLIHSMGATGDFEKEDRDAAANFASAARAAGVRRIIYLGGLGEDTKDLSKHLRSRQEVGRVLRESGAEVIELRASIVIGSGSLSYELVRNLVERLPVMICPSWVSVAAQPIAIEDLLEYLVEAMDIRTEGSRVFEIGGPEQVSYGDLMREYARQRGLRRWMIPVPVLTPYLSSLWLGLVTPIYARIGRKLVASMRNPTVVNDTSAWEAFTVRPRGLREAIARALANEDQEYAQTRWSDALSSSGRLRDLDAMACGSRIVDSRTLQVGVSPADAFAPIQQIGGRRGWYYGSWLWQLRGFLDLLVGGIGVRRGRRHPVEIRVGDTLDFWRVERFEPPRMLRLRAEMKVPGRAWLEFDVDKGELPGTSVIRQTAIFDPLGLAGLAYWYGLYPLHQLVFAGMLRNIARAAEAEAKNGAPPEGD
jgi:uncharacterized protein YbjT (DUF2867 family)